MGRIFHPTPDSCLPTPEKALPSFPRRGGPRLSVVGWFGAVGSSLGDLFYGPSPKLPTHGNRRPPLPSAPPTSMALPTPIPSTLHPSPLTLHSLSPVASGLRPMNERPQLPALADRSPKLPNSPLRLVIGEAPMPQADYGLEAWSRSPRELPTALNHPTTLRRGPPLLAKEGSAFSGFGRRESGVGSQGSVKKYNQPLNQKLPVLSEEGGTRAQRLVGW